MQATSAGMLTISIFAQQQTLGKGRPLPHGDNMLMPQEIDYLYQILDQINVRGEESKAQVLVIMGKLRQMSQRPALSQQLEEESDED